jgi:hypothetical protein
MARAPGKRVVMNRAALDAIKLGAADGAQAAGELVLRVAEPLVPDREPFGRGLVKTGKVVTYVDGRKVAGTGTAPRRDPPPPVGTCTYVGYGFPGRFQELGTVQHPAQPFLTPSMASASGGEVDDRYAQGIRARLAAVRHNATRG